MFLAGLHLSPYLFCLNQLYFATSIRKIRKQPYQSKTNSTKSNHHESLMKRIYISTATSTTVGASSAPPTPTAT